LTNLDRHHYGSEKDFGHFVGTVGFERRRPGPDSSMVSDGTGTVDQTAARGCRKLIGTRFQHSGAALRLPLEEEPEEAA
jgi:hypothetical protein